jgi:hypothetical protein
MEIPQWNPWCYASNKNCLIRSSSFTSCWSWHRAGLVSSALHPCTSPSPSSLRPGEGREEAKLACASFPGSSLSMVYCAWWKLHRLCWGGTSSKVPQLWGFFGKQSSPVVLFGQPHTAFLWWEHLLSSAAWARVFVDWALSWVLPQSQASGAHPFSCLYDCITEVNTLRGWTDARWGKHGISDSCKNSLLLPSRDQSSNTSLYLQQAHPVAPQPLFFI